MPQRAPILMAMPSSDLIRACSSSSVASGRCSIHSPQGCPCRRVKLGGASPDLARWLIAALFYASAVSLADPKPLCDSFGPQSLVVERQYPFPECLPVVHGRKGKRSGPRAQAQDYAMRYVPVEDALAQGEHSEPWVIHEAIQIPQPLKGRHKPPFPNARNSSWNEPA